MYLAVIIPFAPSTKNKKKYKTQNKNPTKHIFYYHYFILFHFFYLIYFTLYSIFLFLLIFVILDLLGGERPRRDLTFDNSSPHCLEEIQHTLIELNIPTECR